PLGIGTLKFKVSLSPFLLKEISHPAAGWDPVNCILSKFPPAKDQLPLWSKTGLGVVVYVLLLAVEVNLSSKAEESAVTGLPSLVTEPPLAVGQVIFDPPVSSSKPS